MKKFLKTAEDVLPIKFGGTVVNKLVNGSFGYPYYIHLVCESIMDAMVQKDPQSRHIDEEFYKMGLRRAINNKYADQKEKYSECMYRLSAPAKEFLKWICLYHDHEIREREHAKSVLVRNGRMNEKDFTSAIGSLTRSRLPITFGSRYINVRDPMFLPCLQKYFWKNAPPDPDVESQKQGLLF